MSRTPGPDNIWTSQHCHTSVEIIVNVYGMEIIVNVYGMEFRPSKQVRDLSLGNLSGYSSARESPFGHQTLTTSVEIKQVEVV